MRLGILTSHPIQYQAPWFRALAREVDLEVFFAHRQSAAEQGKAGFGVAFDWDVDLLSGYRHRFLKNVSARPGVNHFSGCETPEIAEIIERLQDHGAQSGPSFDAFIVTGWYLKSYRQATRACRRAGVPVLVRGDSQLCTPRSRLKRLAMEVRQRWLLRQFDGFLTVGKRNREYLEHYGVPSEKMFFAPHFVDNEWFAARAAEVRRQELEVRKEWGARAEDLVALFVGKFIPKKRPADLLKAMVNLRGESTPEPSQEGNKPTGAAPLLGGVGSGSAARPNPEGRVTRVPPNSVSDSWNSPLRDALAVFVGSGELEPALRADAEALGARAHFAGFKNQSELPRYYAAADVLVLPSDGGETWGLVVNEAMACGLPAIVSDAVGCAPDLIEEGRTGFTFPVGDCAQLALRLESLAEMKMRRHDFARALAEKMGYYSVAAAVSGTVRAARALASKGQTK